MKKVLVVLGRGEEWNIVLSILESLNCGFVMFDDWGDVSDDEFDYDLAIIEHSMTQKAAEVANTMNAINPKLPIVVIAKQSFLMSAEERRDAHLQAIYDVPFKEVKNNFRNEVVSLLT